MRSIWLVGLVMIVAAALSLSSHKGVVVEANNGVCGKFSKERILTHVLRHCKKPAADVAVPVSANCCKDLHNVPLPCLYAVVHSDAFYKVGINPQIALTIPKRCHFLHH